MHPKYGISRVLKEYSSADNSSHLQYRFVHLFVSRGHPHSRPLTSSSVYVYILENTHL
jgi:hypothetical protein